MEIVLVAAGYLAGSIPVSVLVARLSGAADPRTVGSGRIGSMNSLRALGRDRAGLVFVGDLLKGFVPVVLARLFDVAPEVEAAVAVATVIGAWKSVFLGFGGGRGVVTAAGAMLALVPLAVVLAAPVFVLVVVVVRYVSLASLLFTLVDTVLIVGFWAAPGGSLPSASGVAAVVTGAIVWLAHADNIQRLLAGTERRFDAALLRGGSGESRASGD
jgi:acyl phosphate:glycerol-3-phosphate acyltransferase